jgi:hypothetical protein
MDRVGGSSRSAIRARAPRWVWGVGVLLLGLPLLAYLSFFNEWIDRGTWCCEICGVEEERTEMLGATIWSRANAGLLDGRAEQYRSWVTSTVVGEHEHLWSAIGCHRSGATIACSRRSGPVVLELCDHIPPATDVRQIVAVLARSSGTERNELWAGLFDAAYGKAPLRSEPNPKQRLARLTRESPRWKQALAELDAPAVK